MDECGTNELMLEIVGVRFDRQGGPLLQGLYLKVEAGQCVAISGSLGCGKSTLLSLMAGVECAHEGQVSFIGRDLSKLRTVSRQKIRQRIGYAWRDEATMRSIKVMDFVSLPLAIRGVSRAIRRDKSLQSLDRFGISDLAKRNTIELSSSELQLASLARSLVSSPEMLLWDEPTTLLDDTALHRVDSVMQEEQSSGTAIICASNDSRLHHWTRRANWRHLVLVDGLLIPHHDVESASIVPLSSVRNASGGRRQ